MYGTRAAADGWQEEYSCVLVEQLGFHQGLSSPFLYEERGTAVSVHSDDFTATGPKNQLDWYEDELQKHYEVTIQPRVGPGKSDAKEALVLNRIPRWTKDGLECEADPRQSEKVLFEMDL